MKSWSALCLALTAPTSFAGDTFTYTAVPQVTGYCFENHARLAPPGHREFTEKNEAMEQTATRMGLTPRYARRSDLRDIYRFIVLRRREKDYRLNAPLRRIVDEDLMHLEEKYDGVHGQFLVLRDASGVVRATAALVQTAPGVCELKKVYVDPDPKFRGQGLGKALVVRMIALARKWDAQRIELKTSSGMNEAIDLYEKQGFVEVPRLDVYGASDRKYALTLRP